MPNQLSAYLQYIVPQQLLTRFAGWVAECRTPWFKNYVIQRFVKKYHIDMREAQIENPTDFATFNDFFIRQLKPSARNIASGDNNIISPVDGAVAQIGGIQHNRLLQVKNQYFNLETLLGDDQALADLFYDGSFTTLYLAPNNYHRVHMPMTGTLKQARYIPGQLFSVNRMTSEIIPGLYSRNERYITVFDTAAGPMAVILVGAMIVGNIQTVWMNKPTRARQAMIDTIPSHLTLKQGEELGYFKLGSTVILLFGKDKIKWSPSISATDPIQFGQLLGQINSSDV